MSNSDNLKIEFSQYIEDCMSSLFQLALRLTCNNANAEDLVAESVAKAWVAFATLEDKTRFRPWIFRILHNCFISDYRKKSIRPTESSYNEADPDPDDRYDLVNLLLEQPHDFLVWWADPEHELANRLMGEDILNALDKLPESFRTTVILITVEGLSYDEAAEVLGIPPGTVRSRMKRGRTLLQKYLWQHALEAGLLTATHSEEYSA